MVLVTSVGKPWNYVSNNVVVSVDSISLLNCLLSHRCRSTMYLKYFNKNWNSYIHNSEFMKAIYSLDNLYLYFVLCLLIGVKHI